MITLWVYYNFYLFANIFMKKNKKWLTLIEILVVVALIWILAVGLSKINFNPLMDKQKSLAFSDEIINNIESLRNNSLYWKWVGSGSFTHPTKWVISVLTGSWQDNFQAKYTTWAWLQIDDNYRVNFIPHAEINKMVCYNTTKTLSWSTNSLDIEISWSTISLSGCTFSWTIAEISAKYKQFEQSIWINTISGVIEKKEK